MFGLWHSNHSTSDHIEGLGTAARSGAHILMELPPGHLEGCHLSKGDGQKELAEVVSDHRFMIERTHSGVHSYCLGQQFPRLGVQHHSLHPATTVNSQDEVKSRMVVV